MIEKLEIKDFADRLLRADHHFFGRVSFEERSVTIPMSVSGSCWLSAHMLASRRRSSAATRQLEVLSKHFQQQMHLIELDTGEPLQVASMLQNQVRNFSKSASNSRGVIDVTAFRREELLMLVAILKEVDPSHLINWSIAYTGARDMGEWLSGEVTSVRSVLGYPGDIRPSKSTKLVLLMGFENSRARSIIDAYEPKQIILGTGRQSDSITEALYQRNRSFVRELENEFKGTIEKTFEFSPRDPLLVEAELNQVIERDDGSNIVIAPLHTKLSTIGAGLYALKNRQTQICYAAVEEYNEAAYSAPGPHVFVSPLAPLLASSDSSQIESIF